MSVRSQTSRGQRGRYEQTQVCGVENIAVLQFEGKGLCIDTVYVQPPSLLTQVFVRDCDLRMSIPIKVAHGDSGSGKRISREVRLFGCIEAFRELFWVCGT